MIQTGKLNRPITISQPSTTQDAYGQPQSTWAPMLSCWAAIAAITSRDIYATGLGTGAGFTSQVSHKVTIRWRPDVAIVAGMKVNYQDRSFTIQAVSDPDEGRAQLNLYCLDESR